MQESATASKELSAPFYRNADWLLLIFLALFTNQSNFSLKLLGLLLIFIARPNLKLGLFKGRVPLFYPLIIAVACINAAVRATEVPASYLSALCVGCFLWGASLLGYHQVRLSIERNSFQKTQNTLKLFTLFNVAICLAQLLRIMIITHKLNPFRGLDFPYGMSTGDKMFGFFFENSYYNMMVSSFLVVYFLYQRNLLFALLAMLTVTVVFGNTGTFFFLLVLLLIFAVAALQAVLGKGRMQPGAAFMDRIAPGSKTLFFIPLLIAWCVTIYLSISPENYSYLVERTPFKKMSGAPINVPKYSSDTPADAERYIDLSAATAALDFRKYSLGRVDATDAAERRVITNYAVQHMQGKKLSLLETYHYLRASPLNLLLGGGAGRFSSGASHRVSGMDSSRIFLRYVPHYTAPAYRENHMLLSKYRLAASKEYYSNANWPECFYNQIFGEYGLIGALLFFVFYIGYFVRRHRLLSWGLWLIPLVCAYGILCYLFDTLCIMTFFELLMLHNIKSGRERESRTWP